MGLSEWVLCPCPTLSCLCDIGLVETTNRNVPSSLPSKSSWAKLLHEVFSEFLIWQEYFPPLTSSGALTVLLFTGPENFCARIYSWNHLGMPAVCQSLHWAGSSRISVHPLLVYRSSLCTIPMLPTRLEDLWREREHIHLCPPCLMVPRIVSGPCALAESTTDSHAFLFQLKALFNLKYINPQIHISILWPWTQPLVIWLGWDYKKERAGWLILYLNYKSFYVFYAHNIILYTWNVCVQVPLDGDWTFNTKLRGATNSLIIPYGILVRQLRDRQHFLCLLGEETGRSSGGAEGAESLPH